MWNRYWSKEAQGGEKPRLKNGCSVLAGEQENRVGSLNRNSEKVQNAEVMLGRPFQPHSKHPVTLLDKGNNSQPLPSPARGGEGF